MIQIKLILILHKDNPSKNKMQFWNNDFIYEGLSKPAWPYVKK